MELNYQRVLVMYHNDPTDNDKWIKKIHCARPFCAHTQENEKHENTSKLARRTKKPLRYRPPALPGKLRTFRNSKPTHPEKTLPRNRLRKCKSG